MSDTRKFYINGAWVDPVGDRTLDVINPATEQPIATISLGAQDDVNRAVDAAHAAFPAFSRTSREERIALLGKIAEVYQAHLPEMAETISNEMGAPMWLATRAQAPSALAHLLTAIEVLKNYQFEEDRGATRIRKEAIGVCGFITPWNWPVNQIACKVAPALAVGCTMVLKPSEFTPLSAMLLAKIMHEAGVPAGVFNLVNGDGPTVGAALSSHPKIDMVSFTGSTRAGIEVARNAAPTVKRVAQELGGKSANIILDDADLEQVIARDVFSVMMNSGQSCNAPTRMLVPDHMMDQVAAIAKATAESIAVGDPKDENTKVGPVASDRQWDKIQGLIQQGIDEGATLVTGGTGKPEGLNAGYYVKPTIFANVTNDMVIAREEIFGPVLSIIGYGSDEEAVEIANDTDYGLSGYVTSADLDRAREVAEQIRSGNIHINGAGADFSAPFGGYKQSGNGREWGDFGFEEFLEVKAMMGYTAK